MVPRYSDVKNHIYTNIHIYKVPNIIYSFLFGCPISVNVFHFSFDLFAHTWTNFNIDKQKTLLFAKHFYCWHCERLIWLSAYWFRPHKQPLTPWKKNPLNFHETSIKSTIDSEKLAFSIYLHSLPNNLEKK